MIKQFCAVALLVFMLLTVSGCASYPSYAGTIDVCDILIRPDGSVSLHNLGLPLDELIDRVASSDTPTGGPTYIRIKGPHTDPRIARTMKLIVQGLFARGYTGCAFLSDPKTTSTVYTKEEFEREKNARGHNLNVSAPDSTLNTNSGSNQGSTRRRTAPRSYSLR